MSLTVTAPAKVNLSLHITGKRDDGYHLLDSLVVFTEYGDSLNISDEDAITLELDGPFAPNLAGEDINHNLVVRAAQSLQQSAGITRGAALKLYKNIPVGAGLGGGSADAAAVLRGLMRLWNISMDQVLLHSLALRLGSDVPVCLAGQPGWMRGVGDVLAPCDLQLDAWLVLVNPRVSLLTKDVFAAFKGPYIELGSSPGRIESFENLLDLLNQAHNVLEKPAISLLPVIGDILEALGQTSDCALARMSGSGATCFGLYKTHEMAQSAAQKIQALQPGWWVASTAMKVKG